MTVSWLFCRCDPETFNLIWYTLYNPTISSGFPNASLPPTPTPNQFINVKASVTFPTLPLHLEADFCQQPGSVTPLFSFRFSIITVIPHYFRLFLLPPLYFVAWLPLLSMGLVNLEDWRPHPPTPLSSLPPLCNKNRHNDFENMRQQMREWIWFPTG